MIQHVDPIDETLRILVENYYPAARVQYKRVSLDAFHGALQTYEASKSEQYSLQSVACGSVNKLIQTAIERQASDIHLVPRGATYQVYSRCDGHLTYQTSISHDEALRVINRLKVLARMDIAENRRPQTGQFRSEFLKKPLEIRVASHPTLYGESLVLRLLNKSPTEVRLTELGFDKKQVQLMRDAVSRKSGLIIVTGPTGSGKTTTLYSLLREIDLDSKNVMTLEQPVEYFLPSVRQTEVRDKGVLSFAEGVRSILRQDPDVILIGEIRDAETAAMAIRAAMTGHLVLTTLHTRTARGVEARLLELGVSKTHVEDLLTLVIAQRLLRVLCECCKIKTPISPQINQLFEAYGLDSESYVYEQNGCASCYESGYKGRFAVGELLHPGRPHTRCQASKGPYSELAYHGLLAVQRGKTTFSEVFYELSEENMPFSSEIPPKMTLKLASNEPK